MKLLLKRVVKADTYTMGELFIDGEYFCDTLEDKVRIENCDCSFKIFAKTCIPEGEYRIEFVWWEKHQKIYPKLIHVPCFEGILIHAGNSDRDSEGCILVGKCEERGKIVRSGYTFLQLMNRIRSEKDIKIEIV